MRNGFSMATVVVLLTFVSCSKPADNTTSNDTTASTPAEKASNGMALTKEEVDRINNELFFTYNGYAASSAGPEAFAVKEEFKTNGQSFSYTLIRHNGKRALEWDPDQPREGEGEDFWINEYDTLTANVTWKAMPEGTESSRVVNVYLDGSLVFENYHTRNMYGAPVQTGFEVSPGIVKVDLSTPIIVEKEMLYLKAKIMDLTENDLEGMNKDDLSILRNEIFARHGHIFKTDKMNNHFSKMEWYYPLVDDASTLFTSYEKRNVDFIKKREG